MAARSLDDAAEAPWKRRYRARAPRSASLAAGRLDRALVVHDTNGVLHLHAWDLGSGKLLRLTDAPVGVTDGAIDRRGETVFYLDAPDGSEAGHLHAVPWAGRSPIDLTPDVDPYHAYGIVTASAADVLVFTIAEDGAFRFMTAGLGAPAREFGRLEAGSLTRFLSADGSVAYIQTFGDAESPDYGVVAFHVPTGEVVGTLDDGPGVSLEAYVASPATGDDRVAATTTASGVRRTFLWSPRTGDRLDIDVDAEGDVVPLAWSPDGVTLVLGNVHRARQRLFRVELGSRAVDEVPISEGTIGPAFGVSGADEYGFAFDASGRLVTTWSTADTPPRIVAFDLASGADTTLLEGGLTPSGRGVGSVSFRSRDGADIQAWLAIPDAPGPHPLIINAHGGPGMVELDRWSPTAQAWLDHGFAWLSVNYRGSPTFGRDFQMAGIGRVGELEVDDLVAARAWVISAGVTTPDAVFACGWSMGGYLALHALGTAPGLWAAGLAGIAVADFTTQYEDENEGLRGLDRQMFGGTPADVPERYVAASPITYVDRVDAPVLIIQGRNDTRCPLRQVEDYERAMHALGKPIEVEWFDAGHLSGDVELRIRLEGRMIGFALDVLSTRRTGSVPAVTA